MSTTVAQIAETAFNNVAAAITDAIKDVTVTRTTRGAYNTTTGSYATTDSTDTGKAVLDTVKPVTDIFPAYKIGPKDQLWLIRDVSSVLEGDKVEFTGDSADYYVKAVQDIVGAGSLFYVVVQ